MRRNLALALIVLVVATSLLGCSKTIDRGSGWRIREVYSPLMEGAPLRALEVRPPGERRWERVADIVSLWKVFRDGSCVVVAVPPSPEGGNPRGNKILATCKGHLPLLVFQNPDIFYLWEPDGIYEDQRAVGLPDGTRGELWVTFAELLERYDRAVAQEQ